MRLGALAMVMVAAAGKDAIVIRMANHVKLDLVQVLCTSLPSASYDLWLLFDNTTGLVANEAIYGQLNETIESVVSRLPDPPRTRFSIISEEALYAVYPHTNFVDTADFLHTQKALREHVHLGWAISIPFVNAWRVLSGEEYPRYWVLEDDTRLTGDDYDGFFSSYDAHPADLITTTDAKDKPRKYTHLRFTWDIPMNYVLKQRQYVERYSLKLLDALHTMTRNGLVAFCEFFSATVCNADQPHCVLHNLKDDDVLGDRFLHNTRVTQDDWHNLTLTQPNRWFHALKWLGRCEDLPPDLALPASAPPFCHSPTEAARVRRPRR